jgi:hypothetical protein
MKKIIYVILLMMFNSFVSNSQILKIANDGRIISIVPDDIGNQIGCEWENPSQIASKDEILTKLQNLQRIFNDPKNVNYIFLRKMNANTTETFKNEYLNLANSIRTQKVLKSQKLNFLIDLINSSQYSLKCTSAKDTLNILFENAYKLRLQKEYNNFTDINGLDETTISNIINTAHSKLSQIKRFLKASENTITSEEAEQIKLLLLQQVEIPEGIQSWIYKWLWVNEGTPTINPVYSSGVKKDSILKDYFFNEVELLANKLILSKGIRKKDFFTNTNETITIHENRDASRIYVYNTPANYSNVVRMNFDTLPSQSEFQKGLSQFGINFGSISGVIGAKSGTFIDGVFRIAKDIDRNSNSGKQASKSTELLTAKLKYSIDQEELQNRLREDSIYLTELVRVLGEPLPILVKSKNTLIPRYYTNLIELPALEKPGKHTLLVRAISKTDSLTILKQVIRYKKKNSFDVSIGLAYTIPDHVYYEFDGDKPIPKRVYQQHVRLITGIHWYPWKIDMSSNKFIGNPKDRISIFGGIGIPNPLNNLYLGLSYDLIPGLKLSFGGHWTRYNSLEIMNDKIKIEDKYRLKLLLPYIGIQFSPVSAISPVLTTLGL